MSDGIASHDKVSRFLSGEDFDSKKLWLEIKPLLRQYESADACLVFDDTIIGKPYTDENELICRHWDHSKGRNIKGINILPAFYVSQLPASDESLCIPLAYETVKKTAVFSEIKTGKQKRQSPVTKNEMMRQMILQQVKNQASFKSVPAGSWFASGGSMRFIAAMKGKYFIFDMKENRLAVTGEPACSQGLWQNISQLEIPEKCTRKGLVEGSGFSCSSGQTGFIDKDRSTGTGFPVSNGFTLSAGQFATLYKKRWSVEEYHKRTRQNASVGSSPARSVKTQGYHLFTSIFAFVKWEKIKLSKNLNHFAVKARLYMAAVKTAFSQLNDMKDGFANA